jgi:hypothetical protein
MRAREPKKPAALQKSVILLELACHAAMGVALGLVFSLAMILNDTLGISTLIAHGADTQTTTTVFVGTFTLAFGVGATLTGFLFTMLEER